MPALKFKAIEAAKLLSVSKSLIDDLETLLECPRSYFSMEVPQAVYISDGKYVQGSAVVEVAWFDRGQELQDKTAGIITKHMNSVGYKEVDVIFLSLDKAKYYENGEHF